ncbi:hypothetical protein [Novosphingobium marinum]|uniref:Uncharacterized protein n=1 Tax=Novosphingobium marinum TaxID=1514948 RepID=A0A7Z0BVT5_9SPHN|nr:hypothetical protein [Novosphingobium marinum]NYH96618.1 hypothetical protein [Novosphingobium marinum]
MHVGTSAVSHLVRHGILRVRLAGSRNSFVAGMSGWYRVGAWLADMSGMDRAAAAEPAGEHGPAQLFLARQTPVKINRNASRSRIGDSATDAVLGFQLFLYAKMIEFLEEAADLKRHFCQTNLQKILRSLVRQRALRIRCSLGKDA